MKLLKFVAVILLLAGSANAAPYVQSPLWGVGKGHFQITELSAFRLKSFNYDRTFTSAALIDHPLSAGSIIPVALQPYVPPESWACTIGAGYLGSVSGTEGSLGCGFNLADSVRAYASRLLELSSKASLQAAGKQIAPGNGPLNLYVQIGGADDTIHPLKFSSRLFFGAGYSF